MNRLYKKLELVYGVISMWTKLIGTVIVCLPLPLLILMMCGLSYADSRGVFNDEIEHWEYSSVTQKVKERFTILESEFDDKVITRTEYNRILARYEKMDKESQITQAKSDLILTLKAVHE